MSNCFTAVYGARNRHVHSIVSVNRQFSPMRKQKAAGLCEKFCMDSPKVSLACFNCLNYSLNSVKFCVSWKIEKEVLEGGPVVAKSIFEACFKRSGKRGDLHIF